MNNNGKKKKEILEMLARREINKEEAERKLSEFGSSVEDQQQAQAKPKGKKNGCLIALIIAFILIIPAILLILFLGWILMAKSRSDDECLSRKILKQELIMMHEKNKSENNRVIGVENEGDFAESISD